MASKVSVANIALRTIGESPITSFTDGTRTADIVAARFDEVLDGELSAFPWNCATARSALAQLLNAPVFGFTYAFELPSDCLRVLKTSIDEYDWRVEGRTIVTSQPSVDIVYTRHVDDMNALSIRVLQIVGFRLAAEISQAITQDRSLTQELWQKYTRQLALAQHADSQEGKPYAPTESPWLTVRD